MACCGKSYNPEEHYGVRIEEVRQRAAVVSRRWDGRRAIPMREWLEKLLRGIQSERCYYCGQMLEHVEVKGRCHMIETKCHIDHVNPRVGDKDDNVLNLVAACSLCNVMKHAKQFSTIKEIREYVQVRRTTKGYRVWSESRVPVVWENFPTRDQMAEVLLIEMQKYKLGETTQGKGREKIERIAELMDESNRLLKDVYLVRAGFESSNGFIL
jgi:hypothetical protein